MYPFKQQQRRTQYLYRYAGLTRFYGSCDPVFAHKKKGRGNSAPLASLSPMEKGNR